jgi:hypothetical protein
MVLICSEAKRVEFSTEPDDLNRDTTETDSVNKQSRVVVLQLDESKFKRLVKLCLLKLNFF